MVRKSGKSLFQVTGSLACGNHIDHHRRKNIGRMETHRIGKGFALLDLSMGIQDRFFQPDILRLRRQHGKSGVNRNTRADDTDELTAKNAEISRFNAIQERKINILRKKALLLQLNSRKIGTL